MKLWKLLLLVAALAAVAVGLVLGINFLVLPEIIHHNKVVAMPDVRGLSVRGAETRLAEWELGVEVVRDRAHPTVPAGLILDQSPQPEARVRGGRTVRVITSSGPPAGALPALAGLSPRQAEITLQRENYRLGRVVKVRRAGVTDPVVVAQAPAAGTRLFKGARVDLAVAEPAAAPLRRMPDLRGRPLYTARQAIAAAGFVLGPVTYERTRDAQPNTILRQSPAPGARIREGEQLELVATSR